LKKPGESEFKKISTEESSLEKYIYTYRDLPQGTVSMYVRVYDKAGNYFDSSEITGAALAPLPASAPTITLTGTGPVNDYYTSTVKVKITPGTMGSNGIKGIRYVVTGANQIAQTDVNGTSGTELNITKNGESIVTAYTIDNAGNLSTPTVMEVNINIKNQGQGQTNKLQAPTITLSGTQGNNGYYKSTVDVKIEVKGSTNGIVGIKYEVTGAGAIKERFIKGTTRTITIRAEGTSVIRAYAVDNVGNMSNIITKEVKKDSIAPDTIEATIRSYNSKYNTNNSKSNR